jgi:hypothetical protein
VNLIKGCEENGQFFGLYQVSVKTDLNGGMIKCQCIPMRQEAVWRCAAPTNHQQQQTKPPLTAFNSRKPHKKTTCYDGNMPGVPFLPNEVSFTKN